MTLPMLLAALKPCCIQNLTQVSLKDTISGHHAEKRTMAWNNYLRDLKKTLGALEGPEFESMRIQFNEDGEPEFYGIFDVGGYSFRITRIKEDDEEEEE